MQILPLKFVREEDKKTIGLNLYHLAKLGHLGLPVVESVIIVPSAELFQTPVHRYLKNHPNLKDSVSHIKAEILKLPAPESLRSLEVANDSLKNNSLFNIDELWKNLLEKWSFELISKIERNEKNIYHLTPQLVVFSANFSSFGRGYYDEDREHAVIKVEQGKLDFHTSSAIENLIIVGNKKLLLPQIYYWGIEDNKIKIVKVLPFTQSIDEDKEKDEKIVSVKNETRKLKTATRLYLNYSGEVINSYNSDGVILNVKKLDNDYVDNSISKLHQFDSTAKIIFNPDFESSSTQVLEYAKTFLFFKNKKKLDLQIILPETFSKNEFLNLKREFASLGIYSKGSLKIWKQFNTPMDFLNMDQYIEAGFDGAIVNIDKIAKSVTGVDAETILRDLKIDWFMALEKFFKEFGLSKIIKNNIPVLVKGKLCANEELLNYFIKIGVWGVVFDPGIAGNFRDHIAYIEKQTIKKISRTEVQK